MISISELERKVPQILKQAGASPFGLFMYIAAIATIGAGYVVSEQSNVADWSDPVVLGIMTISALTCYFFIWKYVKRIASVSQE
jgi:hypothetical protein